MEHEKRVVCAAVKIDDVIFCGVRHWDELMGKTIDKSDIDIKSLKLKKDWEVQGFMDNKDNFLTREEAMVIAKDAGQVSKDKGSILFSEDLY